MQISGVSETRKSSFPDITCVARRLSTATGVIIKIQHSTGAMRVDAAGWPYSSGLPAWFFRSTVLISGYAHSSIHPPFRLRGLSLTASSATQKGCPQCRVSVTSILQAHTSS